MLANWLIRGEALLKDVTPALLSELLGGVTARVNEDVCHIPARILVAGHDEIPGITRIRLKWVREGYGFTLRITEDHQGLTCLERVNGSIVFARSGASVHPLHGIAPDDPFVIMYGHCFRNLLVLLCYCLSMR